MAVRDAKTNYPAAEAGTFAPAAGLATRQAGASRLPGEMPGWGGIMTLHEFIQKMKAGWGFARPGVVTYIGEALEKLGLPDVPITVEFSQVSSGQGPAHLYIYRWHVTGVTLPADYEDRLPKGAAELFYIYPDLGNNGFYVGYHW